MKIIRSVCIGATLAGLASTAVWGMDTSVSGGNPPPVNTAQSPSPASMASPAQPLAQNSPTSTTSLTHEEVQFLNDAVKRSMDAIALGLMAVEKGANDDIKEFGRQLIETHVKDTEDLMEIASRKQVFIPMDQIKLPDKDLKSLAQQPGGGFDKAFVRIIIYDQTAMQAGLQQFLSSQVQDKAVRNLANQFLSDASDHLSDARDLGGELGLAQQELNPPPPVGEAPQVTPSWESPNPKNQQSTPPGGSPGQMKAPRDQTTPPQRERPPQPLAAPTN